MSKVPKPKNSLAGVRLSDWIIVDGFCATRVLLGTDPRQKSNRVAFIESKPKVVINKVWTTGKIVSGSGKPILGKNYGYHEESRQWCDRVLVENGAILTNEAQPNKLAA